MRNNSNMFHSWENKESVEYSLRFIGNELPSLYDIKSNNSQFLESVTIIILFAKFKYVDS